MRVLLVDDEESLLTSLGMVFEEAGFSVATARSVPGAIAQLQEQVPDVVLVDKNLPGFGGGDLVRHIREHHGDLPVLLITAFATASNAKEMLNLAIDDYLEKPFSDIYLVVGAARQALKRRDQRRAAAAEPRTQQLLVISGGSAERFAAFGLPIEVISDPGAISAELGKHPGATVIIDCSSFPAQEIVGLVGIVRRHAKTARVVVFSDVALKVSVLKNLIGAGVDAVAEDRSELQAILTGSPAGSPAG